MTFCDHCPIGPGQRTPEVSQSRGSKINPRSSDDAPFRDDPWKHGLERVIDARSSWICEILVREEENLMSMKRDRREESPQIRTAAYSIKFNPTHLTVVLYASTIALVLSGQQINLFTHGRMVQNVFHAESKTFGPIKCDKVSGSNGIRP